MPHNTLATADQISVRAVTHFVVLSKTASEWESTLVAAANFCASTEKRLQAAGYTVQTLRIVTNPFGEYLDTSSAKAAVAGVKQIESILESDAMPSGTRIRFALGEARSTAELELVPALIQAASDLANCCVNVKVDEATGLPDAAMVAAAARCCTTLATTTEGGEGNFNFTANFNMGPGCPYFPAAYNTTARGATFGIGLEYPGLLVSALQALPADATMSQRFEAMRAAVAPHMEAVDAVCRQAAAEKGAPRYAGIDTSAAPSKDAPSSRRTSRTTDSHGGDSDSSCSEQGFLPDGSSQDPSSEDDAAAPSTLPSTLPSRLPMPLKWSGRARSATRFTREKRLMQEVREAQARPLSAVPEWRVRHSSLAAAAEVVQRSRRSGLKLADEERELERTTEEAVTSILAIAARKTAEARARLRGETTVVAAAAAASGAPPAATGAGIRGAETPAVRSEPRRKSFKGLRGGGKGSMPKGQPVTDVSKTSWAEATAPRPYLVVACAYPGTPLELRGVAREAAMVEEACAGLVTLLRDPTVDEIRAQLPRCRGLHLLCHGDAPLHGECVPLLGRAEHLEALSIAALAALLQPHAAVGTLQHVYLGGCKTHELGVALSEQAGVPCVVSYRARVLDAAAATFGTKFVKVLEEKGDAHTAFADAKASVLAQTERGLLDNNRRQPVDVQKYEFADPDAAEVHHCCVHPSQPELCAATGCPRRQCPWRGRLSPPEEMMGVVSARTWRGRLATGEPSLLFCEPAGAMIKSSSRR